MSHVMRSISKIRYPPGQVELLLVNNRPGPRLEDFSPQFTFRYRCVEEHKRGAAAARNRGIRESEGEWLLLLDDDVIVSPDLLREHMAMHARFEGSVVLGEVGAAPGTSILDGIHLGRTFTGQKHGEVLEYGTITCNLSLRKRDILAAGLFDEGFDIYGFEDLDLGFRLVHSLGLTLRYSSRALAWHYRKLTLEQAIENYFQAGIAFTRFIRKHPTSLLPHTAARISAHLRETLDRSAEFRPLMQGEAQDWLRQAEALQKHVDSEPHSDLTRTLIEKYGQMLHYAYYEGAFLSMRKMTDRRAPLLGRGIDELTPSHRGLAFLWHGPMNPFSGSGAGAPHYLTALGQLGYRLTPLDREDSSLTLKDVEPIRFHFFIHHGRIPAREHPAGPWKIQCASCETTLLPAGWAREFDRMHEIWVPSSFCRDVMRASGVKIPVTVIPICIDARRFRPRKLNRMIVPDHLYCFMSVSGFREQKGMDVLLKAYLSEFSRVDHVILVVKLCRLTEDPGGGTEHRAAAFIGKAKEKIGKKSYAPIMCYYDPIPAGEYPDFLNICDCYVCASRGEGFCLPAMESMHLGKSIIATAFGGQREYLTDENSWLIEFVMKDAHSRFIPYHRQGQWAEPSVEHLRHLMRTVYEKRYEADRKALKAGLDARTLWNTRTMRDRILDRITEVHSDYWSGMEHILMEHPIGTI